MKPLLPPFKSCRWGLSTSSRVRRLCCWFLSICQWWRRLILGLIASGSFLAVLFIPLSGWNILLAARNEGLGGHAHHLCWGPRAGFAATPLCLGVPSHYAFAAMIPMGKPVKQLTKLSRKPVSEFAVLERFDGAPLVD